MSKDKTEIKSPKSQIIAHVRQNADGEWSSPHELIDHLQGTANLARDFAEMFESGKWGEALGKLHDIGKSRSEWQSYIRRKSGFDDRDESESTSRVEHSIYGAKYAVSEYGYLGKILRYGVAGHHSGLPDWSPMDSGVSSLKSRLNKNVTMKELDRDLISKLELPTLGNTPWKFEHNLDLSLWIRMLFSSLVDADYLDTESYMEREKSKVRGKFLDLSELGVRLNKYMKRLEEGASFSLVNEIRKNVRSKCVLAAAEKQGVFSLSVPTGGGKTLSSLSFGLNHGIAHNLDRVIYVVPFTSIIEQNADVFRSVLGEENVVEHHSNISDDKYTERNKLASENWDAPLIVTTSVQFFDSLFASKPGKCRKLHNIANSVVILDEAQMIPTEYLKPIIETLKLLVKHYHITLLLSTATQPALLEIEVEGKKLPGFSEVNEIMEGGTPELYEKLKRVRVEMPENLQDAKSLDEISRELVHYNQVLCVVSDRKTCRELHSLMPEGTYHLSALMCGQHRSRKIEEIKSKLDRGESVRVISTQIVEAGVDFDFPVVYRAFAGLDSLAQAAGRCNREGKLETPGKFVVFIPPRRPPVGILRKAQSTTLEMIHGTNPELFDPGTFEDFFRRLYWKANSLDKENIVDLLHPEGNELGIEFRQAAKKFQMINDSDQKTIIVRYGKSADLIEQLQNKEFDRDLRRRLQRFAVNIYSKEFELLRDKGKLEEIAPDIFALTSEFDYNENVGLIIEEVLYEPEKYILQ